MKYNIGDIFLDQYDREWIITQEYKCYKFKAVLKNSTNYKWFQQIMDTLYETDSPYEFDELINNKIDITLFGVTGIALSAICYFLGF